MRVVLFQSNLPRDRRIEDFVRDQIRLNLQIADGQVDPTKLQAMVKHWSQ